MALDSRVAVAGTARAGGILDLIQRGLVEQGCDVVRTADAASTPDDVRVIVAMPNAPFDGTQVRGRERLLAIVSPVAGTDHIDASAAAEQGVAVHATLVEEAADSQAEATILLMLAATLEFTAKAESFASGWQQSVPRSRPLRGSTIGLVGYGRISRSLIRRLAGWDVNLLVATRWPPEGGVPGASLVSLDQLLSRSDIVSLHSRLDEDTRALIGPQELGTMKPGALLVNTARGGIVDEEALAEAVRTGRIRVALDTFATEPLPAESPLRQYGGSLLTPHCLGHHEIVTEAMARSCVHTVLGALEART